MEQTLENHAAQVLVPAIAITDGELLMRFAKYGDQQAFAALVEKHGRLVWTVCWQVLREHHAIEDAFQSTFFILAKRAKSIRSCDSLCGWLYRVAYRTALRSRMANKAKVLSALGSEADTMEEWSELDEKLRSIEHDEQRTALLEELHALPEKYQQVLALCYLEGKTRRGIADELGCSLETVKGRLARGRQVLRHRLVRRGVSLSLAMAAMTVPVKVATAAVAPNLIALTVTGATAWATGALVTTKLTSGVGAAKAVSATSSQVIHLAHQGTVAMTIASFAKPALVVGALLGAVSGTLAIDSLDGPQSDGAKQVLNLAASIEDGTQNSVSLAQEAESPVVTVSAVEQVDSPNTKKVHKVEAFGFEFASEKLRVPAPPRSPQPVKARKPAPPADVLIPAMPPLSELAVTAPLGVRVPDGDLKLHLKMAQLATRVSQLQLESKKLEIASFGVEGEEKEKLIEASKEKLIEAEAQKLQIQIEQQEQQIEALEEALKEQAKELGKQAHKMAMDTDVVAEQAAMQAKQAAEYATQAERLKIQERTVYVDPHSDQPFAIVNNQATNRYPGAVGLPAWEQSIEAQQGALSLKPGDRIQVQILTKDSSAELVFTVEPMGTVALGAEYGRADVKGKSIIDAEDVIRQLINQVTKDAKVQVTYLHPTFNYSSAWNTPTPALESGQAPVNKAVPSKNIESK
jgi:RNA polymerase sigma factor (sigma-70 family)